MPRTDSGHREIRDLGLKALHPPMRDRRFWAVQALVLALVAGHFGVDLVATTAAIPAGIPVVLLLVPVSYAALNYGLAGSAATAAWATALWLPDLLLPGERGHPGNDGIELAVVLAVAVFVGRHIDREREGREQAHQFARMLLTVQEQEQRRIAQELHDEPLQLLIHLSRSLEGIAASHEVDGALAEKLTEAHDEVLDVVNRLGSVVRGLRPPALDKFGLVPALRGLVGNLTGDTGPEGELEVDARPSRLAADVEFGVFRIAQEAINNALLHADPGQIRVSFHESDSGIRLRVADDGQGFDQQTRRDVERHETFGLLGMKERADLMGGRLRIRSSPARGTVVELWVPRAPTHSLRA